MAKLDARQDIIQLAEGFKLIIKKSFLCVSHWPGHTVRVVKE